MHCRQLQEAVHSEAHAVRVRRHALAGVQVAQPVRGQVGDVGAGQYAGCMASSPVQRHLPQSALRAPLSDLNPRPAYLLLPRAWCTASANNQIEAATWSLGLRIVQQASQQAV